MRYLPCSESDEKTLLAAVGKRRASELFDSIPEELRAKGGLDVPGPLSEAELTRFFQDLSAENADPSAYAWFLGAGIYRHEVSCIVDHVLSRAEFATAYTPYQPELAQGTLQAIFEFQTLICQLTGLDVANASLYDGASAVAEATLMALRIQSPKRKVLIARSLHPHHRAVVDTYCRHLGVTFVDLPPDESGRVDARTLAEALSKDAAAICLQSPNFFGCLEDVAAVAGAAHDAGALLCVSVPEPVSLGIVAPPGRLGADIVTGDAGCFASGPSYGGPSVGFFATRERFVRNLPGRLVGETVDREGRRGFVLTIATREQHIRRERATSNICTNQGLVMLGATVGMCMYGKSGLRELALRNLSLAEECKRRIHATAGFGPRFSAPTFNEFVVRSEGDAAACLRRLREAGVVAGPALAPYYPDQEGSFLVTVTERNDLAELDRLCRGLRAAAGGAE